MAFVRIKGLKKDYRVTRTETQQVLKGVTCDFERGEFIALLGESGCGKSTFLNILSGLDFDYKGQIVIDGQFMRDYTEKDLDNYRKNKVGIVFQSFNLLENLNAYQNVLTPLALLTKDLSSAECQTRAKELLTTVGLADHMYKKPNQLSGGQKQRVAIARALAMNPSILLADEPTGNLDPDAAGEIMLLLQKIAKDGRLVICVTHSEKVAGYCTRILHLEHGNIAKDESFAKNKLNAEVEFKPYKVKENIDKKEIWAFAKNNIKQSFKRNAMVAVSLAIGIFAFVLMFFLSVGLREYVENSLSTGMNKRQINVYAGRDAADVFSAETGTLSSNDQKYFELIDGVDKVRAGAVINNFGVSYTDAGETPEEHKILSVATYFDEFIIDNLVGDTTCKNRNTNDIIISSGMMERLIGSDGVILGKTVTLTYKTTSKDFTIVGVIDDNNGYDTAYISVSGMGQLGFSATNLVYVLADKVANVEAIISDINYDEEQYYAYQPDSLASDAMSYINLGSLVLSIVSAISLFVCAIMIFIVMYISVIERTKEIGILRALGIRRRNIKQIFMTEGGVIGIVAGVIGCLLAIIIGVIANAIIGYGVIGINFWYILLGLAAGFVVSILASMAPSSAAASLDPVEALRGRE
jgi:ABC-type lipoprotein export system ATPase subunit/ABC-type antimicrobial peptide transport system permease subunit